MASRGRMVSLVNGTIATILVALIAVVALVVKPPAPPGIAEFAPQASKPITKAPPGQSSQFGSGAGGSCAAGQVCTGPKATATPVPLVSKAPPGAKLVPSELQCYSWPDGSVTQTFDPQSPPCVASWPETDKGNGGETYQGVTGSEIRITMRRSELAASAGALGGGEGPYVNGLVSFFNSHYELYGRHLSLVLNDGETPDSPSKSHAAAASALYVQPFAVVSTLVDDESFNHDIAKNRTVVVGANVAGQATAAQLTADGPFSWSYEPPVDLAERNLGEFVCSSLAGRPARFSGDYTTTKRKFVIVTMRWTDGTPARDPGPLQATLRSRCGLTPPVVTIESDDRTGQAYLQEGTQLKADGDTTVLSLVSCCNEELETGANQAGWHPEFVYDGRGRQYAAQAEEDRQNQSAPHKLGLGPTNKVLPFTQEPYHQASPQSIGSTSDAIYRALAILAAGIQTAGPHLTPQSLAAGLHGTTFPNPGAGAAPSYQAGAGFPGQDTWMLRDFNVWWPDTVRPPAKNGDLSLCYVDQGRRFSLGSWPDLESKVHSGKGCP